MLPFWIIITVCLGDSTRDCQDLIYDNNPVPTRTACLVEGKIFAVRSWLHDHNNYTLQQIRCTQEEPKEEQPT